MHDHERARHRAVERHRLEGGALVVDDDFLLLDRHPELDDLGALCRGLLVRVHEGRSDQLYLLTRQLEIAGGESRDRQHQGGRGGADQCGSAGEHRKHPSSEMVLMTECSVRRLRQACLCCDKLPPDSRSAT
ncbi:hypothetical protein ABH999_001143 [Bradyrhizobium yuanmingense]